MDLYQPTRCTSVRSLEAHLAPCGVTVTPLETEERLRAEARIPDRWMRALRYHLDVAATMAMVENERAGEWGIVLLFTPEHCDPGLRDVFEGTVEAMYFLFAGTPRIGRMIEKAIADRSV